MSLNDLIPKPSSFLPVGLARLITGITLAGSLLTGCGDKNVLFREKYIRHELSQESRKKYVDMWDKKTIEEKTAYLKKVPQIHSALAFRNSEEETFAEYIRVWESLSEEERLEHIETLYTDYKEWTIKRNNKRANKGIWNPSVMPLRGWKCGYRKCRGHSHPAHRCR
jgi:hypothetical protein